MVLFKTSIPVQHCNTVQLWNVYDIIKKFILYYKILYLPKLDLRRKYTGCKTNLKLFKIKICSCCKLN